MTKEITIDWKGGSRRIELREPDEVTKMHIWATAPVPLSMDLHSFQWIQRLILKGTGISQEELADLEMSDGIDLMKAVMDYWDDPHSDDTDKVGEEQIDLSINENGAVDLEDMQ